MPDENEINYNHLRTLKLNIKIYGILSGIPKWHPLYRDTKCFGLLPRHFHLNVSQVFDTCMLSYRHC